LALRFKPDEYPLFHPLQNTTMDFVTVRTFNNYISANMMLARLRDGGIRCFLKDEFTVTMDPILSGAVGGIKLMVDKDDETEVQQLLAAFDEEFRKNATCPRCGSHLIDLVPKRTAPNMITALLSWIFSSYAISVENVYKCEKCGYESNTLPIPEETSELS
jgi:Putative prokaryotic signal transducing protein